MHSIRFLVILTILAVPFGAGGVESAPVTAVEVSPAHDHLQVHEHDHAQEQVAAPVEVSLRPMVRFTDASLLQQAEILKAVERFSSAGLELPDLEVSLHDTDEPCKGYLGLFTAPSRIRVCSDFSFVIFHELAHAWERNNVDDETRAAFLVVAGSETWSDADTPWNERGIEQAAVTVQKILMAEHINPELDFWADHLARFELLTGQAPPSNRPSKPRGLQRTS